MQWSKSANEQLSARHSHGLLIGHGHLAQRAVEWQSRAMLVSILYAKFMLQTSMHCYQQFMNASAYFWISASKKSGESLIRPLLLGNLMVLGFDWWTQYSLAFSVACGSS